MVLEPSGGPLEERGVRGERRGTALFCVVFVAFQKHSVADVSTSVQTLTKRSPTHHIHNIRVIKEHTQMITLLLFVAQPMETMYF